MKVMMKMTYNILDCNYTITAFVQHNNIKI